MGQSPGPGPGPGPRPQQPCRGPPAARPRGLGAAGMAAVMGTLLTAYGWGQGTGQKVGTAQRSLMLQVIIHQTAALSKETVILEEVYS